MPTADDCWREGWDALAEGLVSGRTRRARHVPVPTAAACRVDQELAAVATDMRRLGVRLRSLESELNTYLPAGSLDACGRQTRTLLKSITDLRRRWGERVSIHGLPAD